VAPVDYDSWKWSHTNLTTCLRPYHVVSLCKMVKIMHYICQALNYSIHCWLCISLNKLFLYWFWCGKTYILSLHAAHPMRASHVIWEIFPLITQCIMVWRIPISGYMRFVQHRWSNSETFSLKCRETTGCKLKTVPWKSMEGFVSVAKTKVHFKHKDLV